MKTKTVFAMSIVSMVLLVALGAAFGWAAYSGKPPDWIDVFVAYGLLVLSEISGALLLGRHLRLLAELRDLNAGIGAALDVLKSSNASTSDTPAD